MSSYLIDSHCHLHDQEWFTPEQSTDFLQQASANNVKQIIVIGTDPVDSENAQKFAAAHPGVYWTYGIHPEMAGKIENWPDADVFLENLRRSRPRTKMPGTRNGGLTGHRVSKKEVSIQRPALSRPVAIGEIGLDYHYDGYDRAAQLKLFERMLQLARDAALPVSLHIRGHEAFIDAWALIDNFPELTGVVHSFTGSKQDLKRALARNFYVGVNGLATYSTLALPPLEKMLLETDAPFLTPVPFRGTINQPGYIRDIAAYLADKMGVAEETIAEQTTKNARELFKLGSTLLQKSQ